MGRFPPCRHHFCGCHRLLPCCRREDFSQIGRQFSTSSRPDQIDQIPRKVNLAPLPARALEVPVNRCLQAFVGIARHQLHPTEAACLEIPKQLLVCCRAFGMSNCDREDFPVPIVTDTCNDEHALAAGCPLGGTSTLPHMSVPSVHAEIGIGRLGQWAVPPSVQLRVQLSGEVGTRLFEKLVPYSASVISRTLRVETPSTYISMSASTRAFSLRW